MKSVLRLGIAAKGSYAYGTMTCTKYDHVTCGWNGVRF